jgi:ABC-2 type transport system permease protein
MAQTHRLLRSYRRLVPVMLADFRSTGGFYLFFSLLLPAGVLYFVLTSAGATDDAARLYFAAGAVATSLAMGPAVMLSARLGLARENREFDYWATLPVSKAGYVLALSTAHLAFSLPGVVGMLVLAVVLLGVHVSGALWALALIPLAVVALVGLGAFVGSRAPSGIAGTLLGNLLLGAFLFLSPMMTHWSAYPAVLRPVAYAIPTTYMADAFRHAMGAATDLSLTTDVAALVAVAVAGLWLTHRCLDWRTG